MILHLDLDTFFVSCERLVNPELNGKPVIVGGMPDQRGVVSACSYEARNFGVHSAMPLRQAGKACPQGIFLHLNIALYRDYSNRVTQVIENLTPQFEKASVDEFYIDATGMFSYLFKSPLHFADHLITSVKDSTGLPASIGIGKNRLMAKIGSRLAKPIGVFYTIPGSEADILAPLPVTVIPGIGDRMEKELHDLKIFLIKDLQKTDPQILKKKFGVTGEKLIRKAFGQGRSEVDVESVRKSISSENTFDLDSDDPNYIKQQLIRCVEEVGYSLRKKSTKGSTFTLKIRLTGFETHTIQETIPFPISDDFSMTEIAFKLFDKIYKKNQWIRLIGFGVSHLTQPDDPPADLFSEQLTGKQNKVFEHIDKIKSKYGKQMIQLGKT